MTEAEVLAMIAARKEANAAADTLRELRRAELIDAIATDTQPITPDEILTAANIQDIKVILAKMLRKIRRLDALAQIIIKDKGI